MPNEKMSPAARWANAVESLSKKLQAHAKAIVAAGDDMFALREQIERVDKTLREMDVQALGAPPDVRKGVETACVEAAAEFWQRFSNAAAEVGWDVHGSTDRRLVARSCFVELKDDHVTIDGLPSKYTPWPEALIGALRPVLANVATDKKGLVEFADLIARAYDGFGAEGEVPIESVFRQCVMLFQPAAFWANVEAAKFQTYSRPIFRCRLSAMLGESVRPSDGRELRLTPTVNRKDVWELFSPAEGRVVQVGRLAFIKK